MISFIVFVVAVLQRIYVQFRWAQLKSSSAFNISVLISVRNHSGVLWSWDHCVYECVCVTFAFFIVLVQLLSNSNKYGWKIYKCNLIKKKNAYHFKLKITKLYWNTSENVKKKKKKIHWMLTCLYMVLFTVHCHILDKALPLNGQPQCNTFVSLWGFIFCSFALLTFVKYKPV